VSIYRISAGQLAVAGGLTADSVLSNGFIQSLLAGGYLSQDGSPGISFTLTTPWFELVFKDGLLVGASLPSASSSSS
jgi:hypothetical protein